VGGGECFRSDCGKGEHPAVFPKKVSRGITVLQLDLENGNCPFGIGGGEIVEDQSGCRRKVVRASQREEHDPEQISTQGGELLRGGEGPFFQEASEKNCQECAKDCGGSLVRGGQKSLARTGPASVAEPPRKEKGILEKGGKPAVRW